MTIRSPARSFRKQRPLSLAALLLTGTAIAGLPVAAQAQANWTGAVSSTWFTQGNWSTNALPTGATNVVIDITTPNTIINVFTANANDVILGKNGGGIMSITGGGQLLTNTLELGLNSGSGGALTIDGAGSTLLASGVFTIGNFGSGSVHVQNGAFLKADGIALGSQGASSNGTLSITGPTSNTDAGSFLLVGNAGTGAVSVLDGGQLTDQLAIVGAGGASTVLIDGMNSKWKTTGDFGIGVVGDSTLTISNGGAVTDTGTNNDIGVSNGGQVGSGTVTVTDANSKWTLTGQELHVGDTGVGTLNVLNGGVVADTNGYVGFMTGATGQAKVDGAGSSWTNTGLFVGEGGSGALTVSAGGEVTSSTLALGQEVGSSGSVTVTGAGSTLTIGSDLSVGVSGGGTLTIAAGGVANTATVEIGNGVGSIGTATVTGANSSWTVADTLEVGADGTGTLNIASAGQVTASELLVGQDAGSMGAVVIDGAQSALTLTGLAEIGTIGSGALTVQNGAKVTFGTGNSSVGGGLGGSGTATVSGSQSVLAVGGQLDVGGQGAGVLAINSSGAVTVAQDLDIGTGGNFSGTATVDGAGSTLQVTGVLNIGGGSGGTLNLTNQGQTYAGEANVGNVHNALGVLTVDGNSSFNTDALTVGVSGKGTLTVQNASGLDANNLDIAKNAGSTGTATITGAGTVVTVAQNVSLDAGTSSLSVLSGGHLTDVQGFVGVGAGGQATATVDGSGTLWNSQSLLTVGLDTSGALTVSHAGVLGSLDSIVGGTATGAGTVTVTDAGSLWSSTGTIKFGDMGSGVLVVSNGGVVATPAITFADQAGSTATATVDGAGSKINAHDVIVGNGGQASLTVTNVGNVNTQDFAVGGPNGGSGTATFDGVGTTLVSTDSLTAGQGGSGILNLTNGASASTTMAYVGDELGSVGTLKIDGAGSQLQASTVLDVGVQGHGAVTISNGAGVVAPVSIVGDTAGGQGSVTVDGAGSTLTSVNSIGVGSSGSGSLTIQNGGAVSSGVVDVGVQVGASGVVTVTGSGSTWNSTDDFDVGSTSAGGTGSGSVSIAHGGAINSVDLAVAYMSGSTGTITIDGAGSRWTNTGMVAIGLGGIGTLTVQNGGVLADAMGDLGGGSGSGTAIITGAGSSWTNSSTFRDGFTSSGTLTLANGGALSATDFTIADQAGSTGTLNIGADPTHAAAAPGVLTSPTVTFGAGNGKINFNHTSGNYVFSSALSGNGLLDQYAGTTRLTGTSTGFSGSTNVLGGTLLVDGALGSGAVGVMNGGTLGGAGSIGGSVIIASGGTLIGAQGQTLSMHDLNLQAGSAVDVTLNNPGGSALFNVANVLELGGTLNITSGGAFGAGVYRLINYGGVLLANVIDIGTTPNGTTASDFSVQTSVAGQVNLLDTAQAPLLFWDGDAAGNAANGHVDGGSGVWTAISTNWTDGGGAGNGPMTPQPGFAVFEGAPGTVTVDTGQGQIAVSGMQFATDGYVVTGQSIVLFDPITTIRVGDGTAAGANYTATISSQLRGSGGLDKTDLGTLILTGNNTYSGNTEVDQGTLQLSGGGMINDSIASIGDAAGSTGAALVTGAGSAWNNSAVMVIGGQGAGSLSITSGGTINGNFGEVAGFASGTVLVDGAGSSWNNSTDLIVGGFGAGALTVRNGGAVTSNDGILGYQNGSTGTVTVTGAGSTWTNATTLVIGSDAAGTLNIANGGEVSAAGGITLAANAGSSGTLNIGAAPASSAIAAGQLDAPTVTFGAGAGEINFNHTGNYVFSAVMSGAGVVDQYAGVTHLAADSSGFSGGTNVLGGKLLVDGKLGAGAVTVSGGQLGGTGSIGGAVTVASGGGLLGVQGQTLTMDSLTLNSGANVNVTLGAPGSTGLFSVTNNLTLDGVLNVTSTAGFGPGVYRLFDYGGTLTDNGLDIGAVPNGYSAAGFSVQTSVANQVNLVNNQTSTLTFWDGDAAGNAGNGKVDGGAGTWSATSTNFTGANGAANGPMSPQPGFVVFEGAAGVVKIDDSHGAVAVTGMQFASDGYRLSGGPITLSDPNSVIRVGDGTAAGAGYTATIGSVLRGAGGLNKTDLGTLVLTGANTYSGGTVITDGALQLGDGSATGLGSINGNIVNNAQLVFDNGGLTDTTGVISGSGSVTVLGSADLTADNTYTGGTTIAASGTLFLGSTTTTGSVVGDIADNGRLGFDRTDNVTFSGVISGSGTVEQDGTGTLTLTGADSYTGQTSVVKGVLALSGNGSIAQSSRLDVAGGAVFDISGATNGAAITSLSGAGGVNLGAEALVLTQAADTFSGSIAGTGGVILEAGKESLTGVNTYTGGTLIAGGTLKGSATSFGNGGVEVDGALVIDQSTGAAFANTIMGAGSFTKTGGGTLDLTGMSGFTGATTVTGGVLAVNGYLGGSVVTVQSGATLGGNGVVGGVVAQSGATVAPGNSIGLLTVNGAYSQAAGSTYQVQLTSTGLSDLINVTGAATIASGAGINVTKLDANPYVIGTQYTVLHAAGGVSGSFDLTGDIKVTAFLGLLVKEDADNVYLDVTKTQTFAQAGATSNQVATGGALDSLPTTGPVVGAVSNLQTDTQAQAAFDQLSGEAHASVKTAQLEDGQLVRDAETARLRSVLDETGASASGVKMWGQAFGAQGTTDGDGNAAKITRTTEGLLFGGDTDTFRDWRVGALAGFGHTNLKVGARQSSGGSDDYHVGLYAGTQQGPWGVRLGTDYSLHQVNMDRSVSFTGFSDHLTSHYRSGLAQAFGDVGYRIPLGRGTVEPFGSFAFESLNTDGFDEHGGAAALKAAGDTKTAAFSTVGVRGTEQFSQGDKQFTLRASLGWRHAYGDVTPTSTAAFAGGANFTVEGTPLAKESLAIGLGLDLAAAHNLTVGVSYGGQLSSQAQDNAAKANLSWRF